MPNIAVMLTQSVGCIALATIDSGGLASGKISDTK